MQEEENEKQKRRLKTHIITARIVYPHPTLNCAGIESRIRKWREGKGRKSSSIYEIVVHSRKGEREVKSDFQWWERQVVYIYRRIYWRARKAVNGRF